MTKGFHIPEYLTLIAANSAFGFLRSPIILIFGQRLLFLSDKALLELSDTSNLLLEMLATESPGSFQQSLQVAIIGEEAENIYHPRIIYPERN